MAAFVSRHTESFATAPQIAPQDLAEIGAMGFKTVVNNRPDGEGGADQPTSAVMEAAALAAGSARALPEPDGRGAAAAKQGNTRVKTCRQVPWNA